MGMADVSYICVYLFSGVMVSMKFALCRDSRMKNGSTWILLLGYLYFF